MGNIFPKWTNRLPLYMGLGGAAGGLLSALFVWYYFSPEFLNVGYQPRQPLPYSHKLHAGELGIDCRYCHYTAEKSAFASVPPTQTCMNCHNLVSRDSEQLELVRASAATLEPVRWARVHKLPEYAYFDHSMHLRAGVGCSTCHGDVASMERVTQMEPLSMSWCLECHRDPKPYLRPRGELTNANWSPPENQEELARNLIEHMSIRPNTDCTTCHR